VPVRIGPEIQAVLRRQLVDRLMAFGSEVITRTMNLFCWRRSRIEC
jgi:hypothetical protein